MTYLKVLAWGMFALAGLSIIAMFATEEFLLLGGAVFALIVGAAFLGAAEAMGYLRDIRDALVAPASADTATPEVEAAAVPQRSIEEISADLDRLKRKV